MSISSNSGGLITRGYGDNQRIVTRGFGVRFDFGGLRKFKKVSKLYEFDILTSIFKEKQINLNLITPLEIIKNVNVNLYSPVAKSNEFTFSLNSYVNYEKLFGILEQI